MGTGWRRAFCTSIPRDREASVADKEQQQSLQSQGPSPSPGSCAKLGFFSGAGSNPSTPRLRCRTTVSGAQESTAGDALVSPNLHCKITPRAKVRGSNPSSPRSPFSILKNSLRFSKSNCGVCMQSVKTGQGTAIYTAECAHAFHFPCIAAHVRKNGALVCPVCNAAWKDVPLLGVHRVPPHTAELEAKAAVKTDQIKQVPPPPANLKTKCDPQQKAYDDDEPLLSPTAGGRFVPIPEVEDEDHDDVEEFRGFFVNPVSSSSVQSGINNGDYSRNVEVSIMPEAAVIGSVGTHETYAVILRVKAPPPLPAQNSSSAHCKEPSRRAPIDLVTVLDVSASMSGAKLQMLKRAMRLVISSLGSADRLSIVAFSACPKRLMPLKRMTSHGQRAARRIIDRLSCSQGTSVPEALRKATKILEDRRERNPVASIMLLSDGHEEQVQTNSGNRRQGVSHVSSTRFAHIEIPVHTYTHEPAEDAFTRCVGGILSVVVQDLRIELGFSSGSDPGEISAVYSCNGRPVLLGSSFIRMGDLYAEEERDLLVELRVPTPVVGSHHVLSVRCSYRDPANQEIINGRELALLVPRAQAVRSSLPKIERLRNLFIATRAIAEAKRVTDHGDLSSAYHLLASTRALLLQSSEASAPEFIRCLEAELEELTWRRQCRLQAEQRRREVAAMTDENEEPLTPTSAWRAAERLAKVATMKKSVSRVSDLHGFENARF
ncbi:hypothetical protein NMG60_11031293 [Bertholletia excelsa]